MFSLYKLANLGTDNSYGQDILRGVVSRPKSGRVGGWVGMVHPDLSQKSGQVRMAYPALHYYQANLGKVVDNPDSARLLSLKSGRVGISQFSPILGSQVGWNQDFASIYPYFCLKNSRKLAKNIG